MKILLLLTLGLALCSAAPQGNEARPRMRGPRRFPLATPGLQSVNRAAASASIVEEPVEFAPTRGASRGTSLPRRGRPTLRPKASIQVEEFETPASTTRAESGSGRSGLQLRRPKSRITTTTTSAPPPAVEEMSEMPEEMQKEEVIVMDDKMEKPMTEENKMMEQIEETIPVAEKEFPEEIKETMVKEAPAAEAPKPKLRPIPIKLGRRGQGAQPTQQSTVSEPESTQSEVPPQRHRFTVSSESGGAVRVRSRGRESASPAQQSKTPVEETSSAAERAPRVRRPTQPKQSTRISSRRTPPVEETIAVEQEVTDTEHSLPFLEDIQESLDNGMQGLMEAVSSTTALEIDIPQDTTTSRTEELLSFDEYDHFATQSDISPKEESKSELWDSFIKDTEVHNKETEGVPPSDIKEIEPVVETEMVPQRDIEVAISNLQKLVTTSSPVVTPTQKHELHQSPKFEEGLTILQRPRSEINPRRSKNKFRDSDIIFRGGEPQVTLIGTLEDTPANELRVILSGLGSRRRGFGRPLTSPQKVTLAPRAARKKLPSAPIYEEDLNYDYYADLYEEEPIRKLK